MNGYNQETLSASIKTKWAGRNLFFHESIDSTNVQAGREAELGAPHGTLVVADKQMQGRGRRGRQWDSPSNANIYFTILLRPEFEPNQASMLTLLMAYCVAKAIAIETGEQALIKWPNDVVMNGKKICGILTELKVKKGSIDHVVIGVGINVGKQEFSSEIVDKATSIETECGKKISRSALVAQIMKELEDNYNDFIQAKNLSPIVEEYNTILVNKDAIVCVLDPLGEFRGIARGITQTGELLMETQEGEWKEIYAGEVSVRGIYGYV